ncbi:unnamed protein product [Rhizopus stolonifer]
MNSHKKNLKWILGRVQPNNRIQKKRCLNQASRRATRSRKPELIQTPAEEIRKLQDELGFTYDSLTTIRVIYEGLYHAYQSSASELEKDKATTHLSDKEKELLTGYVELNLKASHLQRQLAKMESRMTILKEEMSFPSPVASPCSSVETTLFEPIQSDIYNIPYSPCTYPNQFFTCL